MKSYVTLLFSILICTIDGNIDVTSIDERFRESWDGALSNIISKIDLHPDAGLNISQFLEKYSYPLEYHDVPTEDGFILTLHRIPYGRNGAYKNITNKPAVYLVPGLTCSSMDWVFLGPDSSLALLLADAGYDVWLANTRGTTHSMRHKSLNSSDAAFWDYSWHEKGYYDLAASLDYIVETANVEKLTLIGFSEGTTDSMVLPMTRPEYNDKINLLVLLSPIGYMENLKSPLTLLAVKYMEVVEQMFKTLNINGVAYSPSMSKTLVAVCSDESPFNGICGFLIEMLCGYDFAQLNNSIFSVFLSNAPAGFSVKELVHYGQEIRSGYFRQYDYGKANMEHYGTDEPPSYDPSKITAPVAAYYGKNDFFAAITDVKKFLDQLPNLVQDYLIEYELFNHIDFIVANDIKTLLYDQVISDIKKYNPLK